MWLALFLGSLLLSLSIYIYIYEGSIVPFANTTIGQKINPFPHFPTYPHSPYQSLVCTFMWSSDFFFLFKTLNPFGLFIYYFFTGYSRNMPLLFSFFFLIFFLIICSRNQFKMPLQDPLNEAIYAYSSVYRKCHYRVPIVL